MTNSINLIERNIDILQNTFDIAKNSYLDTSVTGYYHQFYRGHNLPGNPQALNILKNTYNTEKMDNLNLAGNAILGEMLIDITKIITKHDLRDCVLMCVPRAKALTLYEHNQLIFKQAVSLVATKINITDGTNFITRTKSTRTTHLKNHDTDGDMPYKGITIATCSFDSNNIKGKNIVLIDDIYTRSVNIDEDCIQALLDNDAKSVTFYCIGYTQRN